jgi:hypothetical protein
MPKSLRTLSTARAPRPEMWRVVLCDLAQIPSDAGDALCRWLADGGRYGERVPYMQPLSSEGALRWPLCTMAQPVWLCRHACLSLLVAYGPWPRK